MHVMATFNQFDHALTVGKDRLRFIAEARKAIAPYLDFVYIMVDENVTLSVCDNTGKFGFVVNHPKQADSKQTVYVITFAPHTESRTDAVQTTTTGDDVINSLKKWLKIMQGYHTLPDDPDEVPLSKLKAEEEADFVEAEVVEVSDTEPYPQETKVIFYRYLEALKNFTETNYGDLQAAQVVQDINSLQRDLPKLTQKATVSRWQWIAARIKKHSIKFYLEVFSEARKKFINRLLSGKIVGDIQKGLDWFESFGT